MAQRTAVNPPPRARLHWVGALLLIVGCGSGGASTGSPANGGASGGADPLSGGPNLNVDPGACPDAGTLPSDAGAPLADAGTCTKGQTRSFTREIVPLFNSCAGEVCHSFSAGGIARQIGLPSLECCNERLLIEPGHPERSYVLQKLRGTELCGGARMPLDHPPFNESDLQTVSDWICQGAPTTP